jgi:hypothetical protein
MIVGLCLAMLGILFGFVLGGVFGAAEDSLKGYLQAEGDDQTESREKPGELIHHAGRTGADDNGRNCQWQRAQAGTADPRHRG